MTIGLYFGFFHENGLAFFWFFFFYCLALYMRRHLRTLFSSYQVVIEKGCYNQIAVSTHVARVMRRISYSGIQHGLQKGSSHKMQQYFVTSLCTSMQLSRTQVQVLSSSLKCLFQSESNISVFAARLYCSKPPQPRLEDNIAWSWIMAADCRQV